MKSRPDRPGKAADLIDPIPAVPSRLSTGRGNQHPPMRLARFNQLTERGAAVLLEVCLPIPRWSEAIAAGLPYPAVDDLLEAARDAAHPFTDAEVELAHRELRPTTDELIETITAQASDRDGRHDIDTHWFEAAARECEDTFGHPILLRTAGRSEQEILHHIQHRLTNSPEAEIRATAHELRQLGVLQLTEWVRP